MENPHSGPLSGRDVVNGLLMGVVDYCKHGKPYRKRTSIWTNTGWQTKCPLCARDCEASVDGKRHASFAQRGAGCGGGSTGVGYTLSDLYSIPPALCDEISEWEWP